MLKTPNLMPARTQKEHETKEKPSKQKEAVFKLGDERRGMVRGPSRGQALSLSPVKLEEAGMSVTEYNLEGISLTTSDSSRGHGNSCCRGGCGAGRVASTSFDSDN